MGATTDVFAGWPGSLDELGLYVERQLGGRLHDVRIELSADQALVLQGRTHTYYARELAQHIALEAVGQAVRVCNEIVVC